MKFNWKRIVSVSFMALLVVSIVLPSINVSAYDGGLLNGKSLVKVTSSNSTNSYKLTDRDESTGDYLYNAGSISWYYRNFTDLQDISTLRYTVSSSDIAYVYFYSDTLLPYSTPPGETTSGYLGRVKLTDLSSISSAEFEGVKSLAVVPVSSISQMTTIYEFDVFPYTPDSTPPATVGSLFATGSDGMVELTWNNPTDIDFSHVKILRDGVLLADNVSDNFYFDTDVVNGNVYQYELISVDSYGNQSVSKTVQATPNNNDSLPPSEVTSISQDVGLDTITFDFVKPLDDDFERTILYKDGVEYDSTTGTSITVTGLSEATTYSFKFTTVDMTGNESSGVIRSVTTLSSVDDVAPSAPTGLTHIVGNGSITLDWNNNQETDLDGYFVYIDGQKANATPIKSSYYTINALTNSQDYQVAVSAVDKSGNESPISTLTTVTPSESAMPLLSIGGYDLTDVADGVGVWFASLWLILAFAVAIPLSFYIANRVKLLFLA